MRHPLENRFTYFNHHHQKPVTRGKRRINGQHPVHLVGFSPWVPWDVCSVYQKADEQYSICLYLSVITRCVRLWDSAHPPWWCDCPPAPAPARCRIRTTQIYQGVFLFSFFQADYAFPLLPSSPQIKQNMFVDLQILFASLCTISTFYTSKRFQAFIEKSHAFSQWRIPVKEAITMQSLPLYKLDSVTHLSPKS